MKESTFNPVHQEKDISSKIVAGMERISEVFRVLLWEKAKIVGLSPIQIQLLLFIAFHKQRLCNVSHLAKEFNLTKPTISDAIKALDKKGLILKDYSSSDSRSYSIALSESGQGIIAQVHDFSNPLKKKVDGFNPSELDTLFGTLSRLIYQLNQSGILNVQRTCYGCKFHIKTDSNDYCRLLQKELSITDIRLDCSEFELKEGEGKLNGIN